LRRRSNIISGGSGTSMTKTFTAITLPANHPGYTKTNNWNFGNRSTATGNSTTYTYPAAGTYTARLITNWYALNSTEVICADTAYTTVTAGTSTTFNCATASTSFNYSGQT
jgi:hypothetical protein